MSETAMKKSLKTNRGHMEGKKKALEKEE